MSNKTKSNAELPSTGMEAHGSLVHHFIASHGRAGQSFREIYDWGDALADGKLRELGFADRDQLKLCRNFSLRLEGPLASSRP